MTGTKVYSIGLKWISMNKGLLHRLFSSAALAATLVINALANILPINGLTTGEVADQYFNLFTPAGFTFGIWSVIYALLLGFMVYTWIRRDDEDITGMLGWFELSCVLNISWILVWHHLMPGISVLIMLMLLLTLIRLFLLAHRPAAAEKKQWIFVTLPFSVYLAWICVATIANIAAYLSSTEWNALMISEETWTVLMLAIACALALRISSVFRTPAIIAVLLWTLAGIYFRWRGSEFQVITYATIILAVALVVFSLLIFKGRKISA